MSWHGHLQLNYRLDGERCIAHDRHHGPLRVLQRLYPEGDAVCHHVLVHPPGGLVGGDVLDIDVDLAEGSHALITTPGATRFYRSLGPRAMQRLRARVAPGARLEWLPLETIAYRDCVAENHLRFELAPGAEMMGWDLLALGLPAAGEAWDRGQYQQRLELLAGRPDEPSRVWLEQARIDARDQLLLQSPLGWAGRRVLATLWLAAGEGLSTQRRDALLEAARELIDQQTAQADGQGPAAELRAGVSATHAQAVLLRCLAPRVEPAMQLLTRVWGRWRELGWQLAPCPPRVWRT